MGVFSSKHARSGDGKLLSLDVVANRPRLESHEVGFLQLTPHGVYATLAAHVYGAAAPEMAIQVPLPDGWEVLLQCSSLHLDKEGYFAVAYAHRGSRHCIISERGTSEVLGLRAGVWMYFGQPTIQFFLAAQFSKAVRHKLEVMNGGCSGSWFISYTGHSLGAVIAGCRAVEEGTLAVTFESPGAQVFIEKMLDAPRSVDEHLITYLRAPNPINTLKPQCGYVIMIPTQQVVLPSGTLFLAPSNQAATKDDDERQSPRSGSCSRASRKPSKPPSSSTSPINLSGSVSPVTVSVTTAASPCSSASQVVAASTNTTAAATLTARSPTSPSAQTSNGSNSGPGAVAANTPPRWRIPSFRPQEYLRGYLFGGVGMGVPELQQYVSKVEPMIREMLEHAQQVHSIHSLRDHFQKADEPGDEEVVLRWPSHLLQFMEFYNTTRALEDPENQDAGVKEAYLSLMRRLYYTEPRRRDCIPIKYLDSRSLLVVRVWWSMDAAQRKQWPLSLMDHKALNVIQVKNSDLCSSVMTAMQAKQYLVRLVARPEVREMIDQWQGEPTGSSTEAGSPQRSKL
ncbi:conserved hypothetical protein [Leishmania braziliensis MHOM/BR/75/M2904]|uniref:Fungal lipase-like domain-containing protein n=2 Tax=Leishmania braziliensis TaxID=5660 RepID=A4HIZ0_LEIBR|nr:conserved hypothetical protein [Leishmania braziliensis MHOM/BR/75/M2904]KAI5685037.1 hypothetical protein MNV84_05654 [Leishmania braziliensis]CAJ2476648.1 unnamed protein product [Leishmania braziliensis]CAM42446.1 conserved hypothetical protein [Leishmania braziliensis MHOM/BR/75/M2904]SYZ67717.1 hypothetical_protein [Leishmania braziliensis MHOM/BR/75/M2904]